MAKKKNFDSQTNPVRCKKEDKETLNHRYTKIQKQYKQRFRKILVEKRSEE